MLLFGYEECDGFWLMVALAGFDGRSYILSNYATGYDGSDSARL